MFYFLKYFSIFLLSFYKMQNCIARAIYSNNMHWCFYGRHLYLTLSSVLLYRLWLALSLYFYIALFLSASMMLWLYYFYDYVIDNANWHSEPLMFSELKILFGGVLGPLPQFSLQILSVL